MFCLEREVGSKTQLGGGYFNQKYHFQYRPPAGFLNSRAAIALARSVVLKSRAGKWYRPATWQIGEWYLPALLILPDETEEERRSHAHRPICLERDMERAVRHFNGTVSFVDLAQPSEPGVNELYPREDKDPQNGL